MPVKSSDNIQSILLNPQQQDAIQWQGGHLIIIAGPGTGKTSVLTHRIAHLVNERGILPEHILAVTFTNKASQEMKERLDVLGLSGTVTISTFHGLGLFILQTERQEEIKVYDEDDSIALLENIFPELTKNRHRDILSKISKAKAGLETPDEKLDPEFAGYYQSYQQTLNQEGAVDFDDLVLLPVRLLESSGDVLARYQARFPFILIDEYQDINYAQYRLIRLMITQKSELCVIGDPDQAIYGFRGANSSYFLRFQEDFPGAMVIKLTQNYRSTEQILKASHHIISLGSGYAREPLWSGKDGSKVQVYGAQTEKAEAEFVVHTIERLVGGTSYFSLDSGRVDGIEESDHSFSSFCVLFRTGGQAVAMEEALARSGIPYQIIGARSFFTLPKIKEHMLILRWAIHPTGNQDLLRLLHYPLKFPSALILKLQDYAKDKGVSIEEALEKAEMLEELNITQKQRIREGMTFLNELCSIARRSSPEQALNLLFEVTGFGSKPDEEDSVKTLLDSAKKFVSVYDFLEYTALQSAPDAFDRIADKVTLMTIHASKGLEFSIVFIIGLEDGLIPHEEARYKDQEQEERRLFYVGMTRARERLYLVWSQKRQIWGKIHDRKPSPYLEEIPKNMTETVVSSWKKKTKKNDKKNEPTLFDGLD